MEKMHLAPLLSGVQSVLSCNLLPLNLGTAGSTQECWLIREYCANYQVLTRFGRPASVQHVSELKDNPFCISVVLLNSACQAIICYKCVSA